MDETKDPRFRAVVEEEEMERFLAYPLLYKCCCK